MPWPPWHPAAEEKSLARYVVPEIAQKALGPWDGDLTDADGDPTTPAALVKHGGRGRLAEIVYERLAARQIAYQRESLNLDAHEQSIRDPVRILHTEGQATCLDLACLFSGLCLSVNLLPLIVMLEGHSLVLVSLENDPREWAGYRPEAEGMERGRITERDRIVALLDDQTHLAIECTGAARMERPGGAITTIGFADACAEGVEIIAGKSARGYLYTLDIATLHAQGPAPYVPAASRAPSEPSLAHPLIKISRARNPDFLGREDLLAHLAAGAPRGPRPPGGARPGAETGLGEIQAIINQTALAGLGGVGKTQLALEYAYRSGEQSCFALIRWLRADDRAVLVGDLAELAVELGLAMPQSDQSEAAMAALRWCRAAPQERPWLLIYDNATDPELIGEFLPGGGPGQIIITSRQREWKGLATSLDVDTFSTQEGGRFLCERTGRDDRPGAEALADRLGGLALALAQAAAYLNQTGTAFAEYIEALERRHDLLSRPGERTEYQDTVAGVVAESRRVVQAIAPLAGELMDVIAYLDSDHIPTDLLRESGAERPGFDPSALDDAIIALSRYSLISTGQGGFAIHRLVQEITRHAHKSDDPAGRAIALLHPLFPSDARDPALWPAFAALSPHVVSVDRTAPEGVLLEARSWLLDQAGTFLRESGDAAASVPLLRRALEIDTAVHGEDGKTTLTAMGNLASTLKAQGDLPGARALEEQVLEARRRLLGPEHPDTLTAMGNLASTLKAQGDLPGARTLQEQVLEASRRLLGPEHPQTLTAMGNLGATRFAAQDYDGARELQATVLGVQERLLGPEHPETLATMQLLQRLAEAATSGDQYENASAE